MDNIVATYSKFSIEKVLSNNTNGIGTHVGQRIWDILKQI